MCVIENGAGCAEALGTELIDRILWLVDGTALTEFCAVVSVAGSVKGVEGDVVSSIKQGYQTQNTEVGAHHNSFMTILSSWSTTTTHKANQTQAICIRNLSLVV